MNRIDIYIDENIVILSTKELGKKIAEEQVLSKIKGEKVIIKIPDNIRNITSSFVEGFIYVLYEKNGGKNFINKIEIVGSQEIVDKFNKFIGRQIRCIDYE